LGDWHAAIGRNPDAIIGADSGAAAYLFLSSRGRRRQPGRSRWLDCVVARWA
jgi:hypothetical protein